MDVMTVNAKALDPITVIFQDTGPSAGRIIVECYGAAWSAYWGSMSGNTVRQFVTNVDAGYLANKLCSAEHKRTPSNAATAIKEALSTPVVPDETDMGRARIAETPETEALNVALSGLNAFLCGELPLDGVWFGQKHPNKVGNFWWRKHVRRVMADVMLALTAHRDFAKAVISAIDNGNLDNTADEDSCGVLHDAALDLLAPVSQPETAVRASPKESHKGEQE
jgi:hypothetical protein